jgi:hypothetical protein
MKSPMERYEDRIRQAKIDKLATERYNISKSRQEKQEKEEKEATQPRRRPLVSEPARSVVEVRSFVDNPDSKIKFPKDTSKVKSFVQDNPVYEENPQHIQGNRKKIKGEEAAAKKSQGTNSIRIAEGGTKKKHLGARKKTLRKKTLRKNRIYKN